MLSPETHSAAEVIRLLALEPLPHEGGWFRRVAESLREVASAAEVTNVPPEISRLRKPRRMWSSIHALITPEGFSALHRLHADELWFFHAGDPLESLRLYPDCRGEQVMLGLDAGASQRTQDVIRAGTWQGTRLRPGGRWALVSCVVVPEFAWDDFELGARDELAGRYPEWAGQIHALTRNGGE